MSRRPTMRTMRIKTIAGAVALAGLTLMASSAAYAQASSRPSLGTDAIRAVLAHRVAPAPEGVAIVIGVIDASGSRIVTDGMRAKGGSQAADADTVFEIGSISKVFTSLLLADMVRRGEVALTDPVRKFLPDTVKVPTRGGKEITLEDLATHSSGLPRLPANLNPADPANPYADYSVDQLYQFLSAHTLTRDIGSKYEYSNLGAGLLGHALARRAGMDYEALVRARITGPLGMASTAIAFTPAMKARAASGYNAEMTPVGYWDLSTLAGAGGLRSTAADMLKFLSAALGTTKTPLAPAFAAMTRVRRPAAAPEMQVALGWHVATRQSAADEQPSGPQPVYWHNGGTGGFRTFMGYDPARRVGIVALSNASTPAGVDDVGMRLLGVAPPARPAAPGAPATSAAAPGATSAPAATAAPATASASAQASTQASTSSVSIDPKPLEGYVGRYQLAQNFILTVTREGSQLFGQATGQGRFELFPEAGAAHTFVAKVAAVKIVFEPDAQGRATRLALHQGGGTALAKRLDEGASATTSGAAAASGANAGGANAASANTAGASAASAAAPKERQAITLDPATFDRYAGRYRIIEGMDVSFTREGDRFYTQVTGQPKFELFAESERDFFLKVVDAQISFTVDAQGRATEAILRQNGAERIIKRIE